MTPRILTTAIEETDGTASLDLAFGVARHFGINPDKARIIASEVGAVVKRCRQTAKARGLSANEMDRMASAFEHEETPGAAHR